MIFLIKKLYCRMNGLTLVALQDFDGKITYRIMRYRRRGTQMQRWAKRMGYIHNVVLNDDGTIPQPDYVSYWWQVYPEAPPQTAKVVPLHVVK